VTDLSKANFSERGDVALYANISGDGTTAETTLAVLRFGVASIAVCDDKDLNLQVTARDGGAGTVILRTRIQRVPRAQPAEFEFGLTAECDYRQRWPKNWRRERDCSRRGTVAHPSLTLGTALRASNFAPQSCRTHLVQSSRVRIPIGHREPIATCFVAYSR
jgi:hypothetical protein